MYPQHMFRGDIRKYQYISGKKSSLSGTIMEDPETVSVKCRHQLLLDSS